LSDRFSPATIAVRKGNLSEHIIMRLPESGSDRELSNNMTPMIDVVFLLIIFFLVSSHLARQESQIPLELPEATSHQVPDAERAALTINVLADGGWSVGGKRVELAGLVAALNNYRQRNGERALVRVRTDRAASYARVEPLLREAAKAGLPNISIAVYRPSGGG
jgi:biopolymer transport protein ExbD